MAGPDNSLWFKINEDKGGEVVYFKRRHGKLWKLGDGTFGVVYVVHSDLRDNDFAVKLLYDNDSTTPRPCRACRPKRLQPSRTGVGGGAMAGGAREPAAEVVS